MKVAGRWLTGKSIALSVSEPEDFACWGMGPEHLQDAMAEISRQLLALGAQLVYGGDLRANGFTRLLFELVARYAPSPSDGEPASLAVVDVLAFPVHARLTNGELIAWESEFAEIGELRYLGPNGEVWTFKTRQVPPDGQAVDWADALSGMRAYVTDISDARIVIGGRQSGYLGRMPGILEEAVTSMRAGQPLFAIGGFGGAAQAIARCTLSGEPVPIPNSDDACRFDPNNGLEGEELARLSGSPHVDEIAVLVTRGLRRLFVREA